MNETVQHEILLTMIVAVGAGISQIAFSRRHGIPAIILLLISGFALGPEGLGWVKADSLGPVLPVFVSLAVGIVLFEGGLTLDIEGYRMASKLIRRLLTLGVVVTWLGTATTIHYLVGVSFSFSLLAASLVIVTGPTVIAPLLKLIRLKPDLHSVLSWEAVLIDPIGVFIAVLCFEWIVQANVERAALQFLLRVAVGLGIGVGGGALLVLILRRRWIPEEMISPSVLGGAVLTFGVAELMASESGLLASITAGLFLGARQLDELRRIRRFKAEITDLIIGTLFILLASRLELAQFREFGWKGLLAVAVVIFLIRPASIVACSAGLGIGWREKLFLSWIAPRGIVAASMASLFRLTLEQQAEDKRPLPTFLTKWLGLPVLEPMAATAPFIETFTYSVIVATILLHGLSMKPLADLLGLSRPRAQGWLIVGAHRLGRVVARFIADQGLPVLVVDLDRRLISEARREGLNAVTGDARQSDRLQTSAGGTIGHVLALTDNEESNILICQWWRDETGSDNVYRWNSGKAEEGIERGSRGRIVWADLPKPGRISRKMERGEVLLWRLGPAAVSELPTTLEPAAPDISGNRTDDGRAGLIPLIAFNPIHGIRFDTFAPVPSKSSPREPRKDDTAQQFSSPTDSVLCLRRLRPSAYSGAAHLPCQPDADQERPRSQGTDIVRPNLTPLRQRLRTDGPPVSYRFPRHRSNCRVRRPPYRTPWPSIR